MSPPPTDYLIQTDASLQGSGGVTKGHKVAGRWKLDRALLHINVLETRAVRFVLQTQGRQLNEVHARLQN